MYPSVADTSDLTALGRCLDLSPGAISLAHNADGLGDWTARLIHQHFHYAAIRLLAHALPFRDALWWGCLCAFDASALHPPPDQDERLRMILLWIATKRNQQTTPAGFLDDAASSVGCLALALARAANPRQAADLVETSILLAADQLANRPRLATMRNWLHMGIQIARGQLPRPGRV